MTRKTLQPRLAAFLSCFLGALLLGAPLLRAQAQDNISNMPPVDDNITNDESQNPPSRVARISFLDGAVSLQPGGNGDWGSAVKNRPVTIGDKLWVDQNSRAELQAGQAAIHLGPMTALSFLNLDQNIIQMRLPEGKLNFRVREIREGENYEIDTPNLAFTVKQAGAFRIDVNENGDFTSVTVIRGAGEIAASGQVYPVSAGQRVDATGTEGNVHVATGQAKPLDDLDQWAQQRDLGEDNSSSGKYVNRDTVGYSDLDDYGSWKQEPDYGNVWVPNGVGPDWAPYSNGYWSYVGPWGWTWVGYEPWGFAPYHYGRWHYFGGYWGWCPGPVYAYPFYGPAFVGFLGGGFGVGFGVGFGWFPLGWGEPFHPWYHCGVGYWRNVNIHNTYIRNFNGSVGAYSHFNYRYARDTHAVTTATSSQFTGGERINRSTQHLTEASLRNAQVTNHINASPTRASSFGGGNAHNNVSRPSTNVENRSVATRTAPAAGASHLATHSVSSGFGGANPGSQFAGNRPSSSMQPGVRGGGSVNNNSNRPGNVGRSWSAQGNTSDSGRAPQGFGSSRESSTLNSPRSGSSANRPPWAGSGANNNVRGGNTGGAYNGRSYSAPPSNRGNSGGAYNGRSYSAPPSNRGNSGYSAPRSFSSAPRTYAAPSAPHYSSPAPRSYGGGGGSHSSGGGSHPSGGGGGHATSGGGGHSGGGGGGGGHSGHR